MRSNSRVVGVLIRAFGALDPPPHGQWSDAQMASTDRNHRAGPKVRGDPLDVRQDEVCLLVRREPVGGAQEDERWLASPGHCEEGGEVGVGREDHPVGAGRVREDRSVLGREQTSIADVLDVVPFQAEAGGDPRREVRVDEKPQAG